jgi:hypothetical protein
LISTSGYSGQPWDGLSASGVGVSPRTSRPPATASARPVDARRSVKRSPSAVSTRQSAEGLAFCSGTTLPKFVDRKSRARP